MNSIPSARMCFLLKKIKGWVEFVHVRACVRTTPPPQELSLFAPHTHRCWDTCLSPSFPHSTAAFVSWDSVLFILASQNRKGTDK